MASVVEAINGYSPPVIFPKEDVAYRIAGTIQIISIHADGGDIVPMQCDLDTEALLKRTAMLWTLVTVGHSGQFWMSTFIHRLDTCLSVWLKRKDK